MMVALSGPSIRFAEDAKTGTYSGDAVVVATLTDAAGAPARKQSQDYRLSGKLEQLPTTKAGGLLFFRTPELAPGKYTMHAAVYDTKGSRASVPPLRWKCCPSTEAGGDSVAARLARR